MNRLFPLFAVCMALTTMALGQSTSSIRSDGTILVNGQPFFPFGAYNIPRTESQTSKIQALNDMIAAGFNISTLEDYGNYPERVMNDSLLTIADANNFKILIGTSYSPSFNPVLADLPSY